MSGKNTRKKWLSAPEALLRDRSLLVVSELAELMREESRLPAQPEECPGLPFDRLLLATSPIYRANRRLVRLVGLGAALKRLERRCQPELKRIQKILLDREIPDRHRFSQFLVARENLVSSFHESNHWLISTWLRPRTRMARSAAELRRYVRSCEALAVLLDADLASELGSLRRALASVKIVRLAGKPSALQERISSEFSEAWLLAHVSRKGLRFPDSPGQLPKEIPAFRYDAGMPSRRLHACLRSGWGLEPRSPHERGSGLGWSSSGGQTDSRSPFPSSFPSFPT
jgi:hypothetical protein